MTGPAGRGSIVGAGLGVPELITVKALKRLREAEVILCDRLVNEEQLRYAGQGAELISCGKAPGHHALPQEEINRRRSADAPRRGRFLCLRYRQPLPWERGRPSAGICWRITSIRWRSAWTSARSIRSG
ncbi:MAG: SAM-dependent methyltransferase [Paenibacillus macerans]|uniref:Tetrapyrrole (Corrin/Porphyrin) Methylases family protein n=1 Tax=Paenibacillus macerans TaxID=44252 RepID=A0A090Y668_PAEMA|nr:SAM-dependent methyltransferase [Paenibacillus macerans]KFM94243.1 tetrapyrrole (Corrin/Porphyrin) Methylases family protein [Paenibacillus macerans]MDU7472407.1 SAM-dependent methyltransferase [Paenibacillus macerans]SUD25606.1 uroporphyrin-III C-methyltransferase [Paenibacillus macerans]GBK62502.1 hypothetical protein PbDSM24746_25060 [Paenibacillus macerans]GBK68814.1 hypothetical protein PbJCM17693_25220 [Paenibacillus macerans]